jgi:DNA-binding XRE family transcriptional regulator
MSKGGPMPRVVVLGRRTGSLSESAEYNPGLDLALRAAEYFGLPAEAVFSCRPFTPMSEQLYAGSARTAQ